jgi:sterol desaturase/sphingolipid hydroxylase (fatty acid hydroxylase superfamily)
MFWRFHRVHHSDLDCDVTTGLRFHPFEIVLSILIKFLTISALGIPVMTVVIFEVILNAASMFTHSNIKVPKNIERILRWFIVTPDMHRIHHSFQENETNSNFGFFISLWDRIFGTYINQPEMGHKNMKIGLDEFREPKWQDLRWLIYLPFVSRIKGYAINKRTNV